MAAEETTNEQTTIEARRALDTEACISSHFAIRATQLEPEKQ